MQTLDGAGVQALNTLSAALRRRCINIGAVASHRETVRH